MVSSLQYDQSVAWLERALTLRPSYQSSPDAPREHPLLPQGMGWDGSGGGGLDNSHTVVRNSRLQHLIEASPDEHWSVSSFTLAQFLTATRSAFICKKVATGRIIKNTRASTATGATSLASAKCPHPTCKKKKQRRHLIHLLARFLRH